MVAPASQSVLPGSTSYYQALIRLTDGPTRLLDQARVLPCSQNVLPGFLDEQRVKQGTYIFIWSYQAHRWYYKAVRGSYRLIKLHILVKVRSFQHFQGPTSHQVHRWSYQSIRLTDGPTRITDSPTSTGSYYNTSTGSRGSDHNVSQQMVTLGTYTYQTHRRSYCRRVLTPSRLWF